jgi:hypothetical protein
LKEGADILMPWEIKDERLGERILSRRRHILTAEHDFIEWPDKDLTEFNKTDLTDPFVPDLAFNERFEHDRLSINQWKNIDIGKYKDEKILDVAFGDYQHSNIYSKYSWIDLSKSATFHNIMCEGVVSFAVQCAYWDRYDLSRERLRWFPTVDLDGLTGSPQVDSQFELQETESGFPDRFGVLFSVEGDPQVNGWVELNKIEHKSGETFGEDFYPKALKFTIKIHDSKGIIEDGRTFTKIIFLDK